jgi:hypothetical protein
MSLRRRTSYAALFVGLVLVAGCGTSNPAGLSSPLDSAAPAAPSNVRAEAHGTSVVLAWDANAEANVVGYEIYSYSPDPARENAYVLVTTTPVAATEYVLNAGSAATWYRVKAVNVDAKRSASSTPALADVPNATSGGRTGDDEIAPGIVHQGARP